MTISTPIITIFGATGFVGRAITAALARLASEDVALEPIIRVATRNPARAEFLRQLGKVGQITPVFCNPDDATSVARAVGGASIVVNCVGILAERRRGDFDRLHGELPGMIARAVLDHAAPNARFIHISALGADANSPSRYARSKAAGEGVVRAILPTATIFRPSVVFGPDDSFFNRFAKMALLSPALPLIGGGHTKFQPVYVGDIARAVVAAVASPPSAGLTVELVGPTTYSFRQLMELLLKAIDRKRCLITLPWGLAAFKGAILQHLPGKLLTTDQVKLLRADNVATRTNPTQAQLGVTPTAIETILPTYMDRFKPRGRFSK